MAAALAALKPLSMTFLSACGSASIAAGGDQQREQRDQHAPAIRREERQQRAQRLEGARALGRSVDERRVHGT